MSTLVLEAAPILVDAVTTITGILPTDLEVPDLDADFDTKPAQAGLKLVNQLLAFGVMGLLAAGILIGVLLGFSKISAGSRSTAVIALIMCFVGAMVLGSLSGAVMFFGGVGLF